MDRRWNGRANLFSSFNRVSSICGLLPFLIMRVLLVQDCMGSRRWPLVRAVVRGLLCFFTSDFLFLPLLL